MAHLTCIGHTKNELLDILKDYKNIGIQNILALRGDIPVDAKEFHIPDDGCKFANIPEILVEVRVNSSFFGRRGGVNKAWSDFRDRILVIRTLRYNILSYLYATAIFFINIAPEEIKKYAYRRFR